MGVFSQLLSHLLPRVNVLGYTIYSVEICDSNPLLLARSSLLHRLALGGGGKVLLGLGGISDHGLLAGLPVGGAHLTVLIGVLEGLNQTDGLLDTAPHWQIIDGDLAEVLLVIDDEEATEWDASLLVQNTIIAGHLHRFVGQEGDVHAAQAALLPGCVDPGQVGELAVGGAADHLAVDLTELGGGLREGNDLRGADEGEVQWIEEQDQVLALVVAQFDVLEDAIDDGGAGEFGSGLL